KVLVYCSCFYIGSPRFSFSAYLFCCLHVSLCKTMEREQQNVSNQSSSASIEPSRRRRRVDEPVETTLSRCANEEEEGLKRVRRVQAKGSKKGCMRGKGGPENPVCRFRGVRQRVWGKWV